MKNVSKAAAICFGLIVFFFAPRVSVPAYGAGFSSADPQKIQEALRTSARSLGLQTRFPVSESSREPLNRPSAEPPSSAELPSSAKWAPKRPSPSWNVPPHTAEILLCVSLLAIFIVALMTWRDNVWSSSRARRLGRSLEEEESPPGGQASARMEQTQAQADELAAGGNFAGAMHLLLLRSVDELRRRLRVSIAASLTSREILRRIAALPPEGRAFFADIIDRVEVSYFGTHRPGAEDYKACRNSFDSLSGILRQCSSSLAEPCLTEQS